MQLGLPSWIGGFVNAGLIAGVALAAVPLAIHLLNRQRHKPMPWAAMRFVLAAYRRTRRRVELENLLLLFLRMAAIALLALAVARPFTGAASPLAGLTESRRDLVLVVDGSASTGYREGVETVYEREISRAREIVRELDGGRGDRVRLILAGGYPRLLSWTSPDQALAMLDTPSAPTDEALDLSAALGEVLEYAREDAAGAGRSTLEVRLLTDLQRRAFAPREVPAAEAAAEEPEPALEAGVAIDEQLDELADLGLRVLVEDLGPSASEPPNLGIASVHTLGPLLGPGMPVDVAVEVRNHGSAAKNGVRVVLEVDGVRRPTQELDVPARGGAETVFPVVFPVAGEHVLVARLEGDRLAVDDERAEVADVPPPVRVLLVNGEPGATIDEDEVGFLAAVLEPPGGDAPGIGLGPAPFEARETTPEELAAGEVALAEFDVVWLANVDNLSASLVERLEREVAAGAALVVSMGERVHLENWNARAWRADGSGLLPAELVSVERVPSPREGYLRVKSFTEEHPALAFFSDERWKPLLTEVPIHAFVAARPLDGAEVLATLDDEGSHPLLVSRRYDRGRVVLWTTTIDPRWTRLPESPRTLVPLVHEMLRWAAREDRPSRNVAPGEPLSAEVAGTFPRGAQLVRPDGSRRPIDEEPEALGPARWRLPPVPGKDTERAGVYRVELEGAPPLAFAVRIDPAEGDVARLGHAELASLHRAWLPIEPGAGGDDDGAAVQPQRGELWRWLAIACVAALVLESLWAASIGQRRGPALRRAGGGAR